MQTEDLANAGGEQLATTATTAAPETEKVDTTAQASATATTTTEEGAKPDAAKTEEQLAAEASEAARKLNERKKSASERVQQAVGKMREAERDRDRYKKEAEELRAKLKAPDPLQYDDPSKLTADQVEHALNKNEADRLERRSADADRDATHAAFDAWNERALDFQAEHPDFQQVAYRAPISDETSRLVFMLEEGPAIAYELGKKPELARKIDKMSEREKLIEFGRLSAQISQPPPRKISQSPEPINPVGGKSSGANPDPNKMSQPEFEKWWSSRKK